MTRLQWIALALVALLVGILVTAPARLLLPLLPAEQVVVQGLQGSLWRGSAGAVLVRTSSGFFHLGAVDWRLSPLSLLTLSPGIHFNSEWGQQRLRGYARVSGADSLTLDDFEGQLSASLAQRFAPVAIDGPLQIQLEALAVEDGLPVSAQGRVVWENATFVSRAGPQPLGTYVLLLDSPEDGVMEGEVQTLVGPLTAEGTAELRGRSYSVTALLRSEGPLYPAIEESLMLFAVPRGDTWRVDLEAEI